MIHFRFFVFSCCVLVGFVGKGQSFSWFQAKQDTLKHTFQLNVFFDGNATTLSNKMLTKLLWGGYMDSGFLLDRRDELKDQNNHLGFESYNHLSYRWVQPTHSWTVGIKYRELFGFNYSKDLFGLVFLGNGPYEGRNANLSRTRYAYWQYSGLQAGWTKPLNQGQYGQIYVGLSALYGTNYQELTSKDAYLYTAPDAEYVTLEADFTLQYKKPSNGIGAGVDLGYSIEFGKNTVSLQIEDLGWMYWQKASTYRGDSVYQYKGEKIDNINSFSGDSLFSDVSVTGFANRFGIRNTEGTKTVLLPFSVQLLYKRVLNERWTVSLQGYYTKVPAYVPRATIRAERFFQNNWKAHVGVAYGGFGRENLLFGGQKIFSSHWTLGVEGYFLGWGILPNSHGLGLNLAVKKSF